MFRIYMSTCAKNISTVFWETENDVWKYVFFCKTKQCKILWQYQIVE